MGTCLGKRDDVRADMWVSMRAFLVARDTEFSTVCRERRADKLAYVVMAYSYGL